MEQGYLRCPRMRAGKNRTALTKANEAETVMPSNRNGSATSHTTGSNTRTASANGQETARRMHQAKNRRRAFMDTSRCLPSRLLVALETPKDGSFSGQSDGSANLGFVVV